AVGPRAKGCVSDRQHVGVCPRTRGHPESIEEEIEKTPGFAAIFGICGIQLLVDGAAGLVIVNHLPCIQKRGFARVHYGDDTATSVSTRRQCVEHRRMTFLHEGYSPPVERPPSEFTVGTSWDGYHARMVDGAVDHRSP